MMEKGEGWEREARRKKMRKAICTDANIMFPVLDDHIIVRHQLVSFLKKLQNKYQFTWLTI